MAAGQYIDYDALALEALRGVVKACLAQVARTGLIGEHHFFIAFNTQARGVGLSKRLKEKYPQEMTIVLQHRFWDLSVEDDRFEVKLTFDGIPERLVIPFKAVKVFYDPSVRYILQFEGVEAAAVDGGTPVAGGARPAGATPARDAAAGRDTGEASGSGLADRRRPLRRPGERPQAARGVSGDSRPEEAPVDKADESRPTPRPEPSVEAGSPQRTAPPAAVKPVIAAVGKGGEEQDAKPEGDKPVDGGAKIFDLSKFRGGKK